MSADAEIRNKVFKQILDKVDAVVTKVNEEWEAKELFGTGIKHTGEWLEESESEKSEHFYNKLVSGKWATEEPPKPNNPTSPNHYTWITDDEGNVIECRNLTKKMNFNCGSIQKYIYRCTAPFKSVDEKLKDLRKIARYAQMEEEDILARGKRDENPS